MDARFRYRDPETDPPSEKDANHLGFVWARRFGRIGFEGVPFEEVGGKKSEYVEWRPMEARPLTSSKATRRSRKR
jgi:hypothetical protein